MASVLLLCPSARATWSIVLADRGTGEVAVGCATCWDGQWLEQMLPVIQAGRGAANCQATVDSSGQNRGIIFDGLADAIDPAAVLSAVQAQDSLFGNRQIAIVDLAGKVATHTGAAIPDSWNGHLSGVDGDLVWSIQGNRLAGQPVVSAARDAVLCADGDLADRLMAGMRAAQAMGGDGRCSCSTGYPSSCGSPPPSFTKSAHVGFMIVARVGDLDGDCDASNGCATGRYYMNLEVGGWQGSQPDPVDQMQVQMDQWRASLIGRPDQLESTVEVDPPVLVAGGASPARITIRLQDWRGVQLASGGAAVTVLGVTASGEMLPIGEVSDHGDGTYSLPLAPVPRPGKLTLRCVVDDGTGPVQLHPARELIVAPAAGLSANRKQLSIKRGGEVRLGIDLSPAMAGRPYLLLCSASGTAPGFTLFKIHVPLVLDHVVLASWRLRGSMVLPGSVGLLNEHGRGLAALRLSPGGLYSFLPGSLSFSLLAGPGYASRPVVVELAP
ncbi:MAG: DUF1028 domain-containing protein [Planctomycetota bacterium]